MCALLQARSMPMKHNITVLFCVTSRTWSQGSVTISTNMAGRGTDILLGGNPDYMARLKLRELLMPEVVSQGGLIQFFVD